MSPSAQTPQPQLPQTPAAPAPPPMFGVNNEAGMRQKKQAASNANAFGTFLGSQSTPSGSASGSKTLLGS